MSKVTDVLILPFLDHLLKILKNILVTMDPNGYKATQAHMTRKSGRGNKKIYTLEHRQNTQKTTKQAVYMQ